MKFFAKKAVFVLSCVATSVAFAADAPDWTDAKQATWGDLLTTISPAPNPPNAHSFPYAECGLGQKQSPVELGATKQVAMTALLQPKYVAEPLAITNNGHTVKVNVNVTSGSLMMVGNEQFNLLQYHIHAPSEHVLNGKSYPLEIHFVHSTPDGKLAVLGVFAEVGKVNAEFQKILAHAPTLDPTNLTNVITVSGVNINPSQLLPAKRSNFFFYAGSLTTPPCTEGVNWYVLKNPIQLSQTQISDFEKFYSDNARANQQLNGRQVLSK